MVDATSLESDLRRIRTAVSGAIDRETGKVNSEETSKQAQNLRVWIANFENLYINRAKQRPLDTDKIAADGRKLTEWAWHTYETLLDLALSGSEPPAPVGYGMLPSGYVSPETKTTAVALLRDLLNNYITFRKHILKQ